MIRAEHITDVEGVRLWIADHDATTGGYRKQYEGWHASMDKDMKILEREVAAISKRVARLAGGWAFAGAMLAYYLPSILSHMIGK